MESTATIGWHALFGIVQALVLLAASAAIRTAAVNRGEIQRLAEWLGRLEGRVNMMEEHSREHDKVATERNEARRRETELVRVEHGAELMRQRDQLHALKDELVEARLDHAAKRPS